MSFRSHTAPTAVERPPTDPARPFELMFRACAPTKALFAKNWVLPDVVKAM